MSPLVEPACVCREPGCGIQYAYVPGLTESRDCCYFCSQRKRRVRQAAEDGDRARNDGEEARIAGCRSGGPGPSVTRRPRAFSGG